MKNKERIKEQGFTLVELLISSAVFTLLMGIVYLGLTQYHQISEAYSVKTSIQRDLQLTMQKIKVALRNADEIDCVDGSEFPCSRLRFREVIGVAMDGNLIYGTQYELGLNENGLLVKSSAAAGAMNGAGDDMYLGHHITGLGFDEARDGQEGAGANIIIRLASEGAWLGRSTGEIALTSSVRLLNDATL